MPSRGGSSPCTGSEGEKTEQLDKLHVGCSMCYGLEVILPGSLLNVEDAG